MKKKALGKGLNALISDLPEEFAHLDETQIQEIAIGLILPNKNQPRKFFDESLIQELSISIKENGLIQPIVVSPLEGGRYQIVIGERRYRASLLAGLKTIPCLVKELSESKILEWALIENLQREDLNPLEIAQAYQDLIQRTGYTQEEFASYIGKSRSSVTNHLRLLKLPVSIQDDLINNRLSEGHARNLLALENIDEMLVLRNLIIEKSLSVRETEKYIKNYKEQHQQKKSSETLSKKISFQDSPSQLYAIQRLEEDLSQVLSTSVKLISKSNTQGKIEIHYSNLEEFEHLKRLLKSLEGLKNQFYL